MLVRKILVCGASGILGNSSCVCSWYVLHHGSCHVTWLPCWRANPGRMRLYVQQGLSSRVLRALQVRLRRAMAANDAQSLGGAAPERARSRSRGRGREESEETPKVDQIPLEALNEEPNAPEGNRETMDDGAPTPPKGASRYELMQELISCGKKIAAANDDLNLVLDELKDTKKDLGAGFKILGDQLTATTHAISTMSGAVSHQSSEVTKLLKAFDRYSGLIRWALKGDSSLEQNIQGVQTEISNRASQLESRIGVAFENLSRGLQQLIQVLQGQPSAVTALGSASSKFPPPFQARQDQEHRWLQLWGQLEFQCRQKCRCLRRRWNQSFPFRRLWGSSHCFRANKVQQHRITQGFQLLVKVTLWWRETVCLEAGERCHRQRTNQARSRRWFLPGHRRGLPQSTTAKKRADASINRCRWKEWNLIA